MQRIERKFYHRVLLTTLEYRLICLARDDGRDAVLSGVMLGPDIADRLRVFLLKKLNLHDFIERLDRREIIARERPPLIIVGR